MLLDAIFVAIWVFISVIVASYGIAGYIGYRIGVFIERRRHGNTSP